VGGRGVSRAGISEEGEGGPKITLKVAATQQGSAIQAGSYTVTVRSAAAAPERAGEIAEVLLWWTLPDGITTSIVIRPVDDGAWAAPVVMDPQPGRQRLTLLVIGRKAGGVESIREQRYSLELPGMTLKKEEEKNFAPLGQGVAKPLKTEAAGEESEKTSPADQSPGLPEKPQKGFLPSVPGIAMIIFLTGLVLAVLGAAGYALYRYLPSSRKKRGQTKVLNQGAKGPTKKDGTVESEKIEGASEKSEPTSNPPFADSPKAPDVAPAANAEKTGKEELAEPELSIPAESEDQALLPEPAPSASEEPLPEPVLIPPDEAEELKVDLKDLSF
jgi:hypothetical protein